MRVRDGGRIREDAEPVSHARSYLLVTHSAIGSNVRGWKNKHARLGFELESVHPWPWPCRAGDLGRATNSSSISRRSTIGCSYMRRMRRSQKSGAASRSQREAKTPAKSLSSSDPLQCHIPSCANNSASYMRQLSSPRPIEMSRTEYRIRSVSLQ